LLQLVCNKADGTRVAHGPAWALKRKEEPNEAEIQ
jgi:hypothetical protein